MRRRIAWPLLSGPSFAREVALEIPTTVVCACENDGTAKTVQGLFHRPEFRIYRSTDILGVEYGGALENVIASAAGVSDGLGYGDNTKAGLVSRALAEMKRLGVASGAQADTFAGLSGTGDLMLTCFSRQSRNRDLGERLGRGETDPGDAWRRIQNSPKVIRRRNPPTSWRRIKKPSPRLSTRFLRCFTSTKTRSRPCAT